jgi:xanthine/uracil permease
MGSLINAGTGMLLCKLTGIDFRGQLPLDGRARSKWPHRAPNGFAFDAAQILPFVIVGFTLTLTLMGNMATSQRVSDAAWVRPDFKSMSRGLAGSGLAVIVCGLPGNAGEASFMAPTGMSSVNGITSRGVGDDKGGLLIAAAFVPGMVFSLMATTAPVMGAILVFSALFAIDQRLANGECPHAGSAPRDGDRSALRGGDKGGYLS